MLHESSTISLRQSSDVERKPRNNLSSSFKKLNKSTKKLAQFCSVRRRSFDENEKSIRISKNARSDFASSNTPSETPSNEQIQIIVLLINIKSRHFEIISCELSAIESTVGDLLDVISETASEALKGVNFTGVLNINGDEFKPSMKMRDCTSGKELMIAQFDSMSPSECLKHAGPILKSSKMISMMKRQGILQMEPSRLPNALSSRSSFGRLLSSPSNLIREGSMAVVTKKVRFGKKVDDLTKNADGNGFLYVTVLVFVTSLYVSLF